MSTLRDVEKLALAMPDTVKGPDEDGRPSYTVEEAWLDRAPKRVAKAWPAKMDDS